jgi:hypothetical protein
LSAKAKPRLAAIALLVLGEGSVVELLRRPWVERQPVLPIK